MTYGGHFDVASKQEKIAELEKKTLDVNFWNDRESANGIINEINSLKEIVNKIVKTRDNINNDLEMCELLFVEKDDELLHNLEEEVSNLSKEMDELEIFLLLSGPYDNSNCLLEIHAGAGGTEACDWADMLFRMYLRNNLVSSQSNG